MSMIAVPLSAPIANISDSAPGAERVDQNNGSSTPPGAFSRFALGADELERVSDLR